MSDLALYIHVPFCRQRCAYCHFDIKVLHPKTDPEPWYVAYLNALETELVQVADAYQSHEVTSIFFGGGTPSRLAPGVLKHLLNKIGSVFKLQHDVEINLEANPEDVEAATLAQWQDAGFNRVSFGVQTFHDPSLKMVRRPHEAAGAIKALTNRPEFSKGVSIDLMLGLPFQTLKTLEHDLDMVAQLGVEHVSVYMLETDLPTPLDALRRHVEMPSEDDQADAYEWVCQRLRKLGFTQYEISNFAKPGYACRHNSIYWRCGDYLGLGPAAHSRVGRHYWANQSSLQDYVAQVKREGNGKVWEESWTPERMLQETLVQGMRLSEGVSRKIMPPAVWEQLEEVFEMGLLAHIEDRVALTAKGRLLANEVFQRLILPAASTEADSDEKRADHGA